MLYHLTLDIDVTTPLSKWSDTECQIFVKDLHSWGCPCFVLDGCLQSNPKGVPKWEPCAQVDIYMGLASSYDGCVTLVLNPASGHVLPQFHVVFNNTFNTVPHICEGTIPLYWAELVCNSIALATDENFDIAYISKWHKKPRI